MTCTHGHGYAFTFMEHFSTRGCCTVAKGKASKFEHGHGKKWELAKKDMH